MRYSWKTWRSWTRPARHYALLILINLVHSLARWIPLRMLSWGGWIFGWGLGLLIEGFFLLLRMSPSLTRQGLQRRQEWMDSLRGSLENDASNNKIFELDPLEKEPSKKRKIDMTLCPKGGQSNSIFTLLHCWGDLGCRVWEMLRMKDLIHHRVWADQTVHHLLSEVNTSTQKGQNWVILTAHIGHWEAMAGACALWNYPFTAITSKPKSSPLSIWLQNHRIRHQISTIHPGQGLHYMRKLIKQKRLSSSKQASDPSQRSSSSYIGQCTAFLIDQNTHRHEKTRSCSLFGNEAPLSCTPSRLIQHLDARVLWMYSLRQRDGHYRIYAYELYSEDPVLSAHQALERLILHHPTQWVWLHQRH